ncbi:hypothetical protein BC834DRAFT_923290 [Gloeopeniophorella convolvens]|nr:hypothetical protein BC834DRAFT_923290 [Gloeopeniophorella convolvens]
MSSASDADSVSSSSSLELRSEAEQDAVDAPVLSHAAKRKQKRAQAKKASSSESPEKKPKKEGDAGGHPKRQNSVWIGNLSFKTTPESLKRFFDGVGEITRINLPTKAVGGPPGGQVRRENRGFAYVDFATPDAKTIAIAMSEKHLEGRRLLIKDGGDFKGRPEKPDAPADSAVSPALRMSKTAKKILAAQTKPPAPTLFFGNLGFETTEESIKGLLQAHRAKSSSTPRTMKRRKHTHTRFAFVDFASIDDATSALVQRKNHHLDGRNLVVEYASAEAVRRGPNKPKAPPPPTNGTDRGRTRSEKHDQGSGKDEDASERPTAITNEEPQKAKNSVAPPKSVLRKPGSYKPRPAPGAALAMARREQVAIVPSEGRKVRFED